MDQHLTWITCGHVSALLSVAKPPGIPQDHKQTLAFDTKTMIPDVYQYAALQARIRARIGALPRAQDWNRWDSISDFGVLIDAVHEGGLEYWVRGLSRLADPPTVERHLHSRCHDFAHELASMLPDRWSAFGEWLMAMPGVAWIRSAYSDHPDVAGMHFESALTQISLLPRTRRRAALAAVFPGDYLGDATDSAPRQTPEQRWLNDALVEMPASISSTERQILHKISRAVGAHIQAVSALRADAARDNRATETVVVEYSRAQWRLREELAESLRQMLALKPFHATIVLIYGLLVMLQFERLQALLLAKVYGWQGADAAVLDG